MNENDKKALNRITKQAAKVTQSELSSIDDLYCNIVTKKVKYIMANSCHALHDYYAYENRDQDACPFMQNAAVQKICCTELDTSILLKLMGLSVYQIYPKPLQVDS